MNELKPGTVKVAIVMMRRASCTGDEASNVAQAIIAFEQLFQSMLAAEQAKAAGLDDIKDTDGDDKESS